MTAAPNQSFFVDGSTSYRVTLLERDGSRAQWSVTRTEATFINTAAAVSESELQTIVAAYFDAEAPSEAPPDAGHSWDGSEAAAAERSPSSPWLARWLSAERYADPGICGACGAYVPGGADPAVMSTHDCEGEEG